MERRAGVLGALDGPWRNRAPMVPLAEREVGGVAVRCVVDGPAGGY
ncbi:hypothetical protein [Streptomyces sp. NPDC001070]